MFRLEISSQYIKDVFLGLDLTETQINEVILILVNETSNMESFHGLSEDQKSAFISLFSLKRFMNDHQKKMLKICLIKALLEYWEDLISPSNGTEKV